MRRFQQLAGVIGAVAVGAILLAAQQPPAPAAPAAPVQPTITLAPGLRPVPDYTKANIVPEAPAVPEGFTSLFNGRDLTGWHVSKVARHGLNPDFHVAHGVILGTQRPYGSGGILLTDRKFRDFEFYMEAKPDFGNDSGIFFRTTEQGAGYQITMDYLLGGSMGRFIAEGGIQFGPTPPAAAAGGTAGRVGQPAAPVAAGGARQGATPAARGNQTPDAGMALWKRDDWNTVRVRVVGDVPHATVWINGQQVSDATDTENHAVGGMVEGPIAIQVHGGAARWQPGGFWRWRNLAVKEVTQ